MQNDIDLSDDTLLHRREMAKRVASWKPVLFGPNQYDDSYSLRNGKDDTVIRCHGSGVDGKDDLASHLAVFILFNPPEAVMAHIDEILRLRAEVERLDKEADYLAGVIAAAYCAQENVTHCEKTEGLPLHKLRDACAACWRKAARDTVEGKA